jgi:hypothetical protein
VGTEPRIEREYDDPACEFVETKLGVRSRSCSGERWLVDWADETLLLQS